MPSLKDLRIRIASVKSTQKITSAMKMVAAAKLRKAQEMAEAARPYAERIERMLGSLAAGASSSGAPPMLSGTGKEDTHLLVVVTSDRGLCGGFNGSIVRSVRKEIFDLRAAGKTVKLIVVGRKGVGLLRREFNDAIVEVYEELAKPIPTFEGAATVSNKITSMFEAGEFDVCTLFYSAFQSVITQIPTAQRLIPAQAEGDEADAERDELFYEYEPDEEEILADLLPRNISVQVFKALLENAASEQGARMSAMDNATRNAGEMIDKLTLSYNRQRQAQITKELIEIISGAEAL